MNRRTLLTGAAAAVAVAAVGLEPTDHKRTYLFLFLAMKVQNVDTKPLWYDLRVYGVSQASGWLRPGAEIAWASPRRASGAPVVPVEAKHITLWSGASPEHARPGPGQGCVVHQWEWNEDGIFIANVGQIITYPRACAVVSA